MSISREEQSAATKAALRRALLAWRRQLPSAERQAAVAAMGGHLEALWRQQGWLAESSDSSGTSGSPARSVMLAVYWPIRGEPNLLAHFDRWRERGMSLALPVTPRERAPLRFAHWPLGGGMQTDGFGIASPADPQWVQPDALLIPCVGFDLRGYRLGYGGGYYDRTLAYFEGATFGLGFDGGRLAELPVLWHDIALDRIITERGDLRGGRTIARAPAVPDSSAPSDH
ncbi:MAG: 5-formyltetrahydrofolate cyclo-ligase [Burkholderiaceae bacterium]